MKIIEGKTEFQLNEKTAVAIGKFDGIHLGHHKLLDEIVLAKDRGLKATVFTFDPAPSVYFGTEDDKALTTRDEKRAILASMGVDYLIEYPMNDTTSKVSAQDFIEQFLVGYMNAAYIICGDDLSFGYKGQGDYGLLEKYQDKYGYIAKEISKVCHNGSVISSTRVRNAVTNGDMAEVTAMLGRPYSFIGNIVHGAHLGTGIGFPTINLLPADNKILPPCGVYYSRTIIGGETIKSITNVGFKPTVSDVKQPGIETHLYDFNEDVYGEDALVELLEFKRPEMHFGSVDELKIALAKDVEEGRRY